MKFDLYETLFRNSIAFKADMTFLCHHQYHMCHTNKDVKNVIYCIRQIIILPHPPLNEITG